MPGRRRYTITNGDTPSLPIVLLFWHEGGCLAIKAGRHTGTPIPWANVHPRDEQPCEEVCPCVGAASSGELLPLASLTVGWSEKKVQLLGQHSAMTGTGRLLALEEGKVSLGRRDKQEAQPCLIVHDSPLGH